MAQSICVTSISFMPDLNGLFPSGPLKSPIKWHLSLLAFFINQTPTNILCQNMHHSPKPAKSSQAHWLMCPTALYPWKIPWISSRNPPSPHTSYSLNANQGHDLIKNSLIESYALDSIAVILSKFCLHIFLPVLTAINNLSLLSSMFSTHLRMCNFH